MVEGEPAPMQAEEGPEEGQAAEWSHAVHSLTEQYDGLVRQAAAEQRAFGVNAVDQLLGAVETVPAGQREAARKFVLTLCLGNPELHLDTRASIVDELAPRPR